MKVYMLFIAFTFCLLNAVAQPVASKEIRIGEKIPDITLTGFLDNADKKIQLSDLYKGKVLVIDFFASWCIPCVQSMLYTDSLKNVFGDKLEVLAVGYEPANVIHKFLEKNPSLKKSSMQIITDDTLLLDMFPHKSIPHVIWVNRSGKVEAITSFKELTAKNFTDFIEKGTIVLKEKKDRMNFDIKKKFVVPDSLLICTSQLSWTPDDLGNMSAVYPLNMDNEKNWSYQRYIAYGRCAFELYLYAAYRANSNIKNSYRYRLHVRDSLSILPPEFCKTSAKKAGLTDYSAWYQANKYAYELSLGSPVVDSVFWDYVLSDLNRSLPFTATMKQTKTLCWVIINKTKKSKQLISKGDEPAFIFPQIGFLKKMQNKTIDDLLYYINWFSNSYMVLNETSNTKPIDLDFDMAFDIENVNMDQVRNILRKNGFDMVLKERVIPVLHISDK